MGATYGEHVAMFCQFSCFKFQEKCETLGEPGGGQGAVRQFLPTSQLALKVGPGLAGGGLPCRLSVRSCLSASVPPFRFQVNGVGRRRF